MTAPAAPASPAVGHPPAAVRIRGLRKRYGHVHAVDGLDLTVPEGGIFGLVGPNGAGKTTTMLVAVTLLRPDGGSVEVCGYDPVTEAREVRRRVGYVPDSFGLYDGLTCAEYLDFFAHAYGVPGDRRADQVEALLELVELTGWAHTDVAGLSRGMQQRLSVARGLVHDPRVLVADEPASGLDPRARVELREILRELAAQGVTVLISSHILAELDELCDRIGIVDAGRMIAQGTPTEIRTAMSSAHTVLVRVLGDGADGAAIDEAVRVAEGTGALVRVDGPRLHCEVAGGEEAAAALLAALVGAGVRVVDFREEGGGLERLFMSVTRDRPPGSREEPS